MVQGQNPTGGRGGGYSNWRGRGRSSYGRGFRQYTDSQSAVVADTSSSDRTPGTGSPRCTNERQSARRGSSSSSFYTPKCNPNPHQWGGGSKFRGSILRQSQFLPDSSYEKQASSLSSQRKYTAEESGTPAESSGSCHPLHLDRSFIEIADYVNSTAITMESKCATEDSHHTNKILGCAQSSPQHRDLCAISVASSESPKGFSISNPYDICPKRLQPTVVLKRPLLATNRERRNEMKRSVAGQKGIMLRPGMVLLKGYLSTAEQVRIVKECRDLGCGLAGFYEPGYRDGAKLNLKMMCLGKNWDPDKSEYGEFRPTDGAKAPSIPDEFLHLVDRSIKEANLVIAKETGPQNMEQRLRLESPDICIVNFYTKSGRLGLHQDRDESAESLRKGLPVVSFSIGDSAEFQYCNDRDQFKADKVVLQSGDVLIFGGKARHIFHGVSSILAETAPTSLLDETNLRTGRLNLTFRKY